MPQCSPHTKKCAGSVPRHWPSPGLEDQGLRRAREAACYSQGPGDIVQPTRGPEQPRRPRGDQVRFISLYLICCYFIEYCMNVWRSCYLFSCVANMKKLTSDGKEIVDVQVSVSLKSVSLSFTTVNSPLFQFTSSGTY